MPNEVRGWPGNCDPRGACFGTQQNFRGRAPAWRYRVELFNATGDFVQLNGVYDVPFVFQPGPQEIIWSLTRGTAPNVVTVTLQNLHGGLVVPLGETQLVVTCTAIGPPFANAKSVNQSAEPAVLERWTVQPYTVLAGSGSPPTTTHVDPLKWDAP